MAAIPCVDYIVDSPGTVPKRPKRANPDAIRNRYVNFVGSMDLSPEQNDDIGAGVMAWSIWDIPAAHACQIDDDRGEDLICVAVQDNVYWLDWRRYKDEWDYNAFAPIEQLIRIGPLPSNETVTGTGGYDLSTVKRFHSLEFGLKDGALGVPGAQWWITVGEWENEEATSRTAIRKTVGRMRARVATKGRSFIVTLEHTAAEPVHITYWYAMWQVLGRRIRESGRGT